MRFKLLLGCLMLSGFSGLAYELLWTRLLSFTFGSTSLSFSAVLAVFFGGLALGSWAAGRGVARLERPVRAYGVIEVVTGVSGLLLYPVIRHLDVVFTGLDPGVGLAGALARFAFAAPILIVPTFLMGATLPILCAATIYRDEDSGRGMALIYGFNTVGAFLGAYVITYHLIPGVGVFRSMLVTVGVNLLVGVIALAVDRKSLPRETSLEIEASVENGPPQKSYVSDGGLAAVETEGDGRSEVKILQVASALTFFTGFAVIGFEVVCARLFSSFLQGTIYGVGAVLVCFLIGIGIGSLLLARHVPTDRNAGLYFAALQTVTIASILLLCASIPRIAFTLGNLAAPSESFLPQHLQLLVVFAALFVPTVSSGASFPLLVKLVASRARRSGQALGSMYAANTIGSILGSLVTGFVLIPEFGSIGAISFTIACLGLTAALGGALLSSGSRRLAGLGVGGLALALLTLYDGYEVKLMAMSAVEPNEPFERYWGRHQERLRHMAYFAEGRDATIAVLDIPNARSLTINGLGQGSRGKLPPHHNLESLLVAMVPFVHAREPENALIVGLGAGNTLDLLREFGVPHVKAVELEPRVADAVRVLFQGESPLDADGVELELDDARHYLLLGARRQTVRYDIITSMPFHPWVAASLYTKEFFELAKQNLTPEGVFSTWFGVGRMDEAAVQSLLRAFTSVFANYLIYQVPETASYFLVGSVAPMSLDLDRIRDLPARPSLIEHDELSEPYFLLNRVYATGDESTPPAPEGIVNTDDTAFVEVHAPRSSKSSPILRDFLPREYLHPSLVPSERRRTLYIELLEQLLGSPGGRFPLRDYRTQPDRAARTLAAVKDDLRPEEVAYFEGRTALAQGRLEQARVHLTEATSGQGELSRRAERFRVFTHLRGSDGRMQALLELPPSRDAVLALLDINTEAALERARAMTVSPDDDLAWFFSRAATVGGGRVSDEDKTRFARRLGKKLAQSNRLGLLQLAEGFSREQGLTRETEVFNRRRRSVIAIEVDRLLALGTKAGSEGRYAEAAESLERANRLEPGNEAVMRPLLRALVEQKNEGRTAALIEDFRFLGRSEVHIQALLEAARAGRLSIGSSSESAAATSPGGGSEPIGAGPRAAESRSEP